MHSCRQFIIFRYIEWKNLNMLFIKHINVLCRDIDWCINQPLCLPWCDVLFKKLTLKSEIKIWITNFKTFYNKVYFSLSCLRIYCFVFCCLFLLLFFISEHMRFVLMIPRSLFLMQAYWFAGPLGGKRCLLL